MVASGQEGRRHWGVPSWHVTAVQSRPAPGYVAVAEHASRLHSPWEPRNVHATAIASSVSDEQVVAIAKSFQSDHAHHRRDPGDRCAGVAGRPRPDEPDPRTAGTEVASDKADTVVPATAEKKDKT
jgi:hypothetical protein